MNIFKMPLLVAPVYLFISCASVTPTPAEVDVIENNIREESTKTLMDFRLEWSDLCSRVENEGYSSLSNEEKVWYNVESLIGGVDNGGFISLYYNSEMNYMNDTVKSLGTLEEYRVISMITDMNKLFPENINFENMEERNKIIDSWNYSDPAREALLEKIDHDFYEIKGELEHKLVNYIERNIITEQ